MNLNAVRLRLGRWPNSISAIWRLRSRKPKLSTTLTGQTVKVVRLDAPGFIQGLLHTFMGLQMNGRALGNRLEGKTGKVVGLVEIQNQSGPGKYLYFVKHEGGEFAVYLKNELEVVS